jgi:hypothetical protein
VGVDVGADYFWGVGFAFWVGAGAVRRGEEGREREKRWVRDAWEMDA